MRTTSATVVSATWLLAAPGVVAGLLPWWLTQWQGRDLGAWWLPVQAVAVAVVAACAAVLLHTFARFVREGRGTPVPVAAPEQLVIGGLYRHVRNPMYVAVIAAILGQALLLARVELLWYAMLVAAVTAAFVHLYEEPTLRDRFGTDYETYRNAVPAWLPRLHPWTGTSP